MSQTLIQTVTVGAGGAASIDFTSIPANYTDLFVVFSIRGSVSAGVSNVKLTFNGSTSGYSGRTFMGFGSGSGYSETNIDQFSTPWPFINFYANVGSTSTSDSFSSGSIIVPNYAGSSYKSVGIDWVNENNATSAWCGINAALWSNTAAITSLSLGAYTGNFVQYSSVSLYGIKRTQAIGKPKAIGGTITYADGYWYHGFTGSSTFTAKQDLTADVLIVAGGGSGRSGGGGAGGYRAINAKQLNAGMYPVSVGAGSSGGDWGGLQPAQGSVSAFADIISAGGGDGGNVNANNAASGGSGGGSCGSSNGVSGPGTGNVPATTPPQGYNGGSWNGYANNQYGAGGGGALGVGGNSNATSNGGAGGPGAMWGNGVTYSTGGVGMGANGTGASGAANTGNGGNGGFTGGNGGSGIVIVRYLAD
jgi:hypothetical protein